MTNEDQSEILPPFQNIILIFILGVLKYPFLYLVPHFSVICLEKLCPIIYLLLEFCFFLCLFSQNVIINALSSIILRSLS